MEDDQNMGYIISEHLNKVQVYIEDFNENLDDTHEDEHHIVSVLDDFIENLEDEFEIFYETLKCENKYLAISKVHESMLNKLHNIKQDYILNEDIDIDEIVAECDTWLLYYKKYFR